MAFCKTKMMVFDFSSTSGCWTAAASADWGALIPNVECQLTWPCFAYGCIYFKVHRTTKLVKLDMSTMDFSILNLPDDPSRGKIERVDDQHSPDRYITSRIKCCQVCTRHKYRSPSENQTQSQKDDETSFRVICTMHYEKNLAVSLFFDSGSGSWTVGKSFSWNALISSNEQESYIRILPRPYYVYGSIYWRVVGMNKLLKLNINAMEFSMVDLPLGHDGPSAIFVEAGEGRLGMFSRTADGKFLNYYCYDSIENEDQRANEWQLKNVIPLHVLDHPRIS
ncbi:hypothetical protein EJB05_50724, partial [Eragrostis curvula]